MIENFRVVDDPEAAVRRLRFEAEARPVWNGYGLPTFRVLHLDSERGVWTALIFSREAGHHSSGWLKNPDYERCYHLSLSFWDAATDLPIGFQDDFAAPWVAAVFGDDRRFVWEESAKSEAGREIGVRHYRVFCDIHWQPIMPHGEVYGRELTERGWRSWSEQHPDDPAASHLVHENPDR